MSKRITVIDKVERKRENGSLNESSVFLRNCLVICDEFLDKENIPHSDVFYSVVSYITNAESFFRHLIKEIIDKDPTKLEFVEKIADDHLSKRDLIDSLYALGVKKVSAGELLGQAISISSFGQVIKYFDVFTAMKTQSRLRENSQMEWFQEDYEDDRFQFVFDECINSIEYLFSLRHIFCHENNEFKKYLKSELDQHLFNASGLLDLTRVLSDQILGIPEFRSEAEERSFMAQRCDEKYEKLDKIIEIITENIKFFEENFADESHKTVLSDSFNNSQKNWEKHLKTDSEAVSFQFYGGSAMANLNLEQREWLIDRRIEDLQRAWKAYLF